MSTDSARKKLPICKKSVFGLIIATIVVVALVSIFAGYVIKNHQGNKFDLDYAVSQAIKEHNSPVDTSLDIFIAESHFIFSKKKNGNQISVYLQANSQCYTIDNPLGIVETYGGSWCPCAITFEISEDGNYKVLEYWEPYDGSYYASSIKEKFPPLSALLAIYSINLTPQYNTDDVYEYFNCPKTITFTATDCGHLFGDEKGDAILTLDTSTNYGTLTVNGKVIFTDFYSFFDFDENGDTVPEYIYFCDVDNLPKNRYEYNFTVIDKNTMCVTNLPENPLFTRVEK